MPRRFRLHVRSNLIGYVALFVALGGTGAYATTSFVGSDSQIHGCVGKKGAVFLIKPGHTCHQGKRAIAWNQKGPAGKIGPSNAFGLSRDFLTVVCSPGGGGPCSASMTLAHLPAGAYAIFAKVRGDAFAGSGDFSTVAQCNLNAEADSDQARAELTENTDTPKVAVSARTAMLPLQLVHVFGMTGSAVLTCTNNSDVTYYDAKITAIKVARASNALAP